MEKQICKQCFQNKWTIYFHDFMDSNWNKNSYEKLITLRTSSDFWTVFDIIQPKLSRGMFFFMKNEIFPKWDDSSNNDKYVFISIKIIKENVGVFMENLLLKLVAESLSETDNDNISGLSISPKKNFCICKIWIKSSKVLSKEYILANFDIPSSLYHGDIICKES